MCCAESRSLLNRKMVKTCSHGTCKSDSRKAHSSVMINRYGEPIKFVHFPGKVRSAAKAQRWIHACRRPSSQLSLQKLSYHHYVCSLHFIGENGPSDESTDPLPATLSVERREKLERAFQRRYNKRPLVRQAEEVERSAKKACNQNAPENIEFSNVGQENVTQVSAEREHEAADILIQLQKVPEETQSKYEGLAANNLLSFAESCHVEASQTPREDNNSLLEVDNERSNFADQYESESVQSSDQEHGEEEPDEKTRFRQTFVKIILANPMYYVGIKSKELLEYSFSLVRAKGSRLQLWRGKEPKKHRNARRRCLSTWEEFLLTLTRNRRGTDNKMIADLFGISTTLASNIFITWNLFLSKELKFLRRFPSVRQNEKHLPQAVLMKNGEPKEFVKGLRTIIDTVEFKCETPSLPAAQKQLYSSYKNDNTYKLLIGCNTNGYINYKSALWSGNVSDKELVERSGFLDCLRVGDKVMADKGFQIRGMLALRGCYLQMPPPLKQGILRPKGSTKARKVSNIRIHIERAIRRLKTFKVVSNPQKMTQKSHMDSIISVCVSLANLGNSLVS